MNEQFFLRNLWLWKCGLDEDSVVLPKKMPSYEELYESEWSSMFEDLMRHRLIMGAFRYGLMNDKNKPKFDRMSSIIKRADKYTESGNKEFLVDIANLCLLEFEDSHHENAHFSSIDDGEHVQVYDKNKK